MNTSFFALKFRIRLLKPPKLLIVENQMVLRQIQTFFFDSKGLGTNSKCLIRFFIRKCPKTKCQIFIEKLQTIGKGKKQELFSGNMTWGMKDPWVK